jgi:hypothetical protein
LDVVVVRLLREMALILVLKTSQSGIELVEEVVVASF